ncbi:MAG TPA: PadR family transcriptional regulator [Polyangiaceae bacterium]|nr:PadR family transcriptional regulator [Polyangiaceae bacterium]
MHDPCGYGWDDDMRRPPPPPVPPNPRRWGRWGRSHGDAWAEFWSEWWRGPAARPERGVVRYLILDAIRAQPRHGYEIIQAIDEKSHGSYRPSPGVVYPTLQMLEEMQLARATEQVDRKAYTLTEAGEAELKAHEDEVTDFYEGGDTGAWETPAEDVARVMKRVGQLIKAFKRGTQRGYLGPGKMRKVLAILDDALDKLHALLGDDEA